MRDDSPQLRKARGAFFTPTPIAEYLTRWAVRSPADRVLEPSAGEASFLDAAGRRLTELGSAPGQGQLVGVELNEASARQAEQLVRRHGHAAEVLAGDFFAQHLASTFTAVRGG